MFKKWPLFLTLSEKKITQTFETVKKCGLLEDEVSSAFKKSPSFLSLAEMKSVDSIETFLGLGFSRDESAIMIKRNPQCLNYSVKTVKKNTEFLVKKMNWPVKAVALHPQVAGYSMENRIVPRCNVIKALVSKGLLEEGSKLPPVSAVLSCTDQKFLNKYVMKYDKLVPELMAIYTGKRVS